jgi:hypothetical protein
MYPDTAAPDTLYAITNADGEFRFEKIPSANFTVKVSAIAYKPGRKFRRLYGSEKIIDLGTISLVNTAIILDEIVIHSLPVTVKEDTVEYRGDAFKVKENGVVEDLLKKLPGVSVDKNGNIKAQGRSVTRVKVNGKDFFSGDPKTATRELPANIVDKIQVIDDYGDQASVSGIKDGDPEKVMNIQLKKDKNTGLFGRVSAGAGDKGRYQASVSGNYFKDIRQLSVFVNSNNTGQSSVGNTGTGKGQESSNNLSPGLNGDLPSASIGNNDGITTLHSVGINYRDQWGKKISIYGNYTYGNKKTTGYKIISQQNIFSSGIYFNNQENIFESLGETHRISFNLEYTIDSFNYLKFSPALSFGKNNGSTGILFDYSTAAGKISEGNYDLDNHSTTPNFNSTLLFNHKFRKKGRNLSLNFNAGTFVNNSTQDSRNNTVLYNPSITSSLALFNRQQNNNYNYGIRLTYSEPISKLRFLDLALSHNLSFSGNDRAVYDVDALSGARFFNTGLSNDYENNFFTDRINLSIRTLQKKYNYTFGLSVQPVNLEGISVTKDSAYHPVKRINVFPVARFSYNFSKSRSLTASYRGDAMQPGFNQLQDVIDSSNLQYRTRGNPNLRPSVHHSFNVLYNNFDISSGTVLFTSLTANKIQNQVIYNTSPVGNSGAQITIPQNVNGYYNLSGYYNISRPFQNRKFIINLNGALNYINNINLTDNIKNTGRNWLISQGASFELNQEEWLQVSFAANYNLNSINYSGSASNFQSSQYNYWLISGNFNVDLFKTWLLKYDVEFMINQGLTGEVGKNQAIMNASIEKQLFKKKTGLIRLQALDLLDQNSNIYRSVNANSIIDSRSNKLSRYIMLTFSYRFQKFHKR